MATTEGRGARLPAHAGPAEAAFPCLLPTRRRGVLATRPRALAVGCRSGAASARLCACERSRLRLRGETDGGECKDCGFRGAAETIPRSCGNVRGEADGEAGRQKQTGKGEQGRGGEAGGRRDEGSREAEPAPGRDGRRRPFRARHEGDGRCAGGGGRGGRRGCCIIMLHCYAILLCCAILHDGGRLRAGSRATRAHYCTPTRTNLRTAVAHEPC